MNILRIKRVSVVPIALALFIGVIVAPAAHAAPPNNDMFAAADELTNWFGGISASNVGATRESGEPDHAGVPGARSVWYAWTAPMTGRTRMTASSGWFDSLLAIYTGTSVDSLTPIAANDDFVACVCSSRVNFDSVEGTTYMVAIDSVASKSGTFRLTWAMQPLNDDFAAAEPIVGNAGQVVSNTALATREDGESRRWARRSIWYTWIAPETGAAIFTTRGSRFDTTLSIYRGSVLTDLRRIAGGGTSRIEVDVRAGRSYKIQLGGWYGDHGKAVLNWEQ